MNAFLLSILLIVSPFFASAGMLGGEIGISLTILPGCKIDAAHTGTSVVCADQAMIQPHISEMILTAVPGISRDSKLITVEW